jgi:hypothetical protein
MSVEKMVVGCTYADGPSTRENRDMFIYRGIRDYEGRDCIVMEPLGDTVYSREDDGMCLFMLESGIFFHLVEGK